MSKRRATESLTGPVSGEDLSPFAIPYGSTAQRATGRKTMAVRKGDRPRQLAPKPTARDYAATLGSMASSAMRPGQMGFELGARLRPAIPAIATAAKDYLTQTPLAQMGSDVLGGLRSAGEYALGDPANAIADLSVVGAGRDFLKDVERAASLRARGDEGGAYGIEQLAPLMLAAGIVPGGGAAMRKGERAALRAAEEGASDLAARKSPSLISAIRVNGKVYKGNTHLDALAAIPDPEIRKAAALDANTRGFVNERGRFLDRFKAADYARNFDLFSPDAPSWAKTAPEVISENLRLPQDAFGEPAKTLSVPARAAEEGASDLAARAVPITTRELPLGQRMYATPEGAQLTVMENAKFAPRQHSVTDFVVPEELRGQGRGAALLDEVLGRYDPMQISAAASSPASAALFHKRGFRPVGEPEADLERALQIMRDDSSVTMAVPPSGIVAYHGSPHTFDRFDISKIGTGEGAQSYGHGLYFAGNEDVARQYRDALQRLEPSIEGVPVKDPYLLEAAKHSFSVDDYIKRLERELSRAKQTATSSDDLERELAEIDVRRAQRKLDVVSPYAGKSFTHTPTGSMYKVNLAVRPEDLLDWDAPLAVQAPEIKRVFQAAGIAAAEKPQPIADLEIKRLVDKALRLDPDPRNVGMVIDNEYPLYKAAFDLAAKRGADVDAPGDFIEQQAEDYLRGLNAYRSQDVGWAHRMAEGKLTPRAVAGGPGVPINAGAVELANRLLAEGIPGIKYFDAGSRSANEGTRNYVMFSDKPVSILKRYKKGGLSVRRKKAA